MLDLSEVWSDPMNLISKLIAFGLILAAGVAAAQDATNPAVIARKDLMKSNGMSVKILGDMAGGKAAFDAVAAAAAAAQLAANAADVAAKFEVNEVDPASKASPDVWTNWDDFMAKADALGAAAKAMDTSTVEGVQAGLAGVGGACKDCHTSYRL